MTFYSEKQASEYLARRHGITLSTSRLRKLRVSGGGPRFQIYNGRFSSYPLDELDRFAASRAASIGIVGRTSEYVSPYRRGLDTPERRGGRPPKKPPEVEPPSAPLVDPLTP